VTSLKTYKLNDSSTQLYISSTVNEQQSSSPDNLHTGLFNTLDKNTHCVSLQQLLTDEQKTVLLIHM